MNDDFDVALATPDDRDTVLMLLDQFRTFCGRIIDPEKPDFVSTSARDSGGKIFDAVMARDDCALFLARDGDNVIGIASVYAIPQIRRGTYVAEIEEMFITPDYHGTNAAARLIDAACTWASERGISTIRLESSNALTRAHGFYRKMGFTEYAAGFEKKLEQTS